MAVTPEKDLLDEEFLARQRDRLRDDRQTRQMVVAALEAEIRNHLSRGEAGELPIEGYGTSETASIELDRARDQHAHAVARLADIDAAVARLRSGEYGRCERCGGPIGRERLEALPTATRCVKCQASP